MKMYFAISGLSELIVKLEKPVDYSATMYRIGEAIADYVRGTFIEETDPWGNPWRELAGITRQKREANEDGLILFATGNLFRSLKVIKFDNAAWVGFTADYALIPHQLGESPNPWGKTTPPRPIMPIRQSGAVDLPEGLQRIIDNIIRESMNG